ncbi:hypothetical protein H072_1945 [Dactylellina haptotyla CBS 200.50]|uniref:Conserved oligomeric Golgi complex subunit 4 n=1 Tax=Dactylellina haptotyla (strain CBS 200.50) TaxID=1284197 RepID=S8C8S4_DACHA|nr:hypothetical protein H072_1945 [Dactylellina haptotyla CBS 200.50]
MADYRRGSLNGAADLIKKPAPDTKPPYNTDSDSEDADPQDLQQTEEAALAATLDSIDKASTVDEIQACLANLTAQESKISSRLSSLLASQDELSRELSRLDLIRARLGTQVVAARGLSSGMLSGASSTASRISSAVKQLDIEQENVRATLQFVEAVVELKTCVLGVSGSMGAAQDWETAAQYINRASLVPEHIVNSEFAEEMVPTSEEPETPSKTLSNAAESLCGLFLREFDKATKAGDGEKITRYFKLFPLIGRSDTGLEVYGGYVCRGVAERMRAVRGRKNDGPLFYAGSLSQLFEYMAGLVERHTPLVEKHYGVGRMVKVIDKLQIEVDTQGGIVIDSFWEERSIGRKLSDIKSYAFSFLVQSFLAGPSSGGGTPRSGSPRPGGLGPRNSEDDGIDVKEIDSLLNELSLMISRWSLYSRFIARKCMPALPPTTPTTNGFPKEPALILPPVITKSVLSTRVDNKLSTPFEVMTTFFFRRSVEKAFQLDELPPDLHLNPSRPLKNTATPYITLSVDDVMYLVRNVLKRSLSTCSLSLMKKVIASVKRILESDFVGMMQRRMQHDSYPKSNNVNSPPPDDKVIAFSVLTNNLDVSIEYVTRIINTFLEPPEDEHQGQQQQQSGEGGLESQFPFAGEADALRNALNSLVSGFTTRAGNLHDNAIEVLFGLVVRPRLRPMMSEAFSGIEYVIREGDVANEPESDDEDGTGGVNAVTSRFASGFHHLMFPLKRILTPNSYEKLLSTTAESVANLLAKRLWGLSGKINELGAIRLERDVSGVIAVVVREGKYGLRDRFVKASEIVMILNMEEDEVLEILRRDSDVEQDGDLDKVEWKLSREERRRARGLLRH